MSISLLKAKIEEYRKKYFLNHLIRGSLQFIIVLAALVTLISLLEHYFWFNRLVRAFIFYSSLGITLISFLLWVFLPIARYFHWLPVHFTDTEVAKEIGSKFPEVKDRLLNALQLERISEQDNSLIVASIDSYLTHLKPIPFTNGIDFRINLKYVRYLVFIMLSMVLFSLLYPGLYKNSTKRVLNYSSHYSKPMPFNFDVQLSNQHAFKNESFTVTAILSGESVPSQLYIDYLGRKLLMASQQPGIFSYTFSVIQSDLSFVIEGGGYVSERYEITMIERAEIQLFNILLKYPEHTGRKPETVSNGRLQLPEGTITTWNIQTKATDQATLVINDSIRISSETIENQLFTFNYQFFEDAFYEIILSNEYSKNKDQIKYQVATIKDEYPTLEANFYLDTVLYEYVLISGEAFDDYGINQLDVFGETNEKLFFRESIGQYSNLNSTNYYYQLKLDSLWQKIDDDASLTLYVSVKDNDLINGYKSTRSESFTIRLPNTSTISDEIDRKSDKTSDNLSKSINSAQSINEKIKQLQERLLSKESLEWQEEKLLNELLEQRKKIEEQVNELKQQFDDLNQAENKFNERSEEIKEKAEKLQELMNDVLDEETKKLYEELQKLMEENADMDQLRDQIGELGKNEQNLEKELERALELFKRLKVESELEKTSKSLEKLSDNQEKLAKQSEEYSKNELKDDLIEKSSELSNEQKKLNDQFDQLQNNIDKIKQLNQELKNPVPLQDLSEDMQEIKEGLEKAQEQMEKGQFEQGIKQQQQNSKNLKQMAQKFSQMMESMQMEMLSEDIGNLKNILDDLVKLSFQQESLIDGFYEVTQVDPKFVELSQQQLKLKDDAEVLEDSLLALSQRVVQMSSFITREVGLVNENIDAAVTNLRNRDRNKALSNQQFAMASINNLALLLDDLLQQMQNSQASSSGKGKPDDKNGQGMPNLKELQKQLSQDIQELKDSGMKGRQLSESLSKMAAQQEMLREKLNELKNSLNGQPGGEDAGESMEDAMKLMEQNEIDLVNKRLTQQLINRQEEIMTRMLDAENAMKEQEFDQERKGETAGEIEQSMPKAFQEYLLERKKQIELQKTIPIGLNPFYKKEVNDYFRRLSTEN